MSPTCPLLPSEGMAKTNPPQALPAAMDQDEARRIMGYVNRSRTLTARRLSELDLFVKKTQPQPADPPMVQIILKMRDAIEQIPASSADERIPALKDLAWAVQSAQAEANRASAEVNAALTAAAALQQKAQEHRDKMAAMRARATDASTSVAELIRLTDDPGTSQEAPGAEAEG